MKGQATHKLIQLAAVLGAAGSLAATCGMLYSDERLKREVERVRGVLAGLHAL